MMSCRLFREIRCVATGWKQVKRHAGHSKWHNIRHTKAAKDLERSSVIAKKLLDIKKALIGNGWVTDVKQSPAFARAYEAAVAADVPKETLENFMKKLREAKERPLEFRLRGPNDCILLLQYSVTPQSESYLRYNVKKYFKYCRVIQQTTGFQQAFESKGIILAKSLVEKTTMDDAEEAAIIAGAEEVRPELMEESENVYRFLTDPHNLWSVVNYLKKNEWDVMEANVEDVPTYLVELSESQLAELKSELQQFLDLPEFFKVTDNIAGMQ